MMSEELADDNKTIFTSTELDPAEKAAVASGEARGKREAMREYPERFGLARARAQGNKQFEDNYQQIDWSK